MADERRATFQKTVMFEDGGSDLYSVNLTRAQAWGTFIVSITVVIGSIVGALLWMHDSIAKIADREFEKQLRVFHEIAKPEIKNLIDDKIKANGFENHENIDGRLKGIETRITSLEVTMSLVVPDLRESITDVSKSVEKVSDKLDKLLAEK